MPWIRHNNQYYYQKHNDAKDTTDVPISMSNSSPLTNNDKGKSSSFATSFDSTPFSSYVNSNELENQWGWESTLNSNIDDSFPSTKSKSNKIHDLKITSPSSLHSSFEYPRKSKSLVGVEYHGNQGKGSNSFNRDQKGSNNSSNSPSYQDSLNPTKIIGQVPFRNRFTSAALVSQKLHHHNHNDNEPINKLFKQKGNSQLPVPTQLVITQNATDNNNNGNVNNNVKLPPQRNNISSQSNAANVPTVSFDETLLSSSSFLSNKSNHHNNQWPIISPTAQAEDSFESFGNHSVFSDITGSIITSPIRDQNKNYSMSTSLMEAQEEDNYEAYGDFDKCEVNRTASTHLESSYSDYDDEVEQKELNISQHGHNSRLMDESNEKGKKPSRLASLFTSRALQSYNTKETKRSNSAPNSSHLSSDHLYKHDGNKYVMPSPGRRSNASASSSSEYAGWPGTIGKDGKIVPSSFSDDGSKSSVGHNTNEKPMQSSNSKELAQQSNGNSHDWIQSPTTVGRKSFERNSSKFSKRQQHDHTSRIMALKQQFEADVVDLDDIPTSDNEGGSDELSQRNVRHNSANLHLAKNVTETKSKSPSPHSSPITLPEDDLKNSYSLRRSLLSSNPESFQSLNKMVSKSNEQKTHDKCDDYHDASNKVNHNKPIIDVSASLRRVRSALSHETLSAIPEGEDCFRLSEEALKINERRVSPIRNMSGANVTGFRGFFDKTKDVPNLMDDESDSCSVSTRATEKKMIKRTDISSWKPPGSSQSKEFDDRRNKTGHSYIHHGKKDPTQSISKNKHSHMKINSNMTDSEDELNVVNIDTSLTTIQTTLKSYNNRSTSAEFDANLTESDTDFLPNNDDSKKYNIEPNWPSTLTPSHHSAISQISDSESELSGSNNSNTPSHSPIYDLSMYMIDPSRIRKMVKRYRTLSNNVIQSPINEDSKKAFALFEMRSRIMEADIERGIDRKGWTKVVDDIVLTKYHQASHRVRDAVVVSKAWREGASPSDARTAFYLTTGFIGSYHIKRQQHRFSSTDSVFSDVSSALKNSHSRDYCWEKVLWVDDLEFSFLRCPSLDSRTLRGFDIFTEGDCQSILLKLTNDYCEELRSQLRDASSRQMIAEHIMKEESEGSYDAMTEAEDAYLEAMEEVKTLTKTLSHAEKAFEMTREKIEELVFKYENMLKKEKKSDIENDSNCGDDDLTDGSSLDRNAKDKLTRRAQRAELKAELASREAEIARMDAEKSKKEVERIMMEKENELATLQKRLDELEAKSVLMESFDGNLQKQTAFSTFDGSAKNYAGHSSLLYAASTIGTDKDKNETKERLKAKFRQRRAVQSNSNSSQLSTNKEKDSMDWGKQKHFSGSVQQRLQFYERSLQAVERQ